MRKRAARGEAVILFVAAGHRFAIAASAVEEIRNTDTLRRVARGKIYAVMPREQGMCYVVDAAFHFHMLPLRPRRVLVLRNSAVALAIESVERIVQISALYALPRVFRGEERRWYRGLALVEGDVVPVVDQESFLSKAELAELAVTLPLRAGAGSRGAVPA